MKTQNTQLKIKIDTEKLTPEDLNDLYRWENESGLPSQKSDIISSLLLNLQKGKILKVNDHETILEDDQLYLLVTHNATELTAYREINNSANRLNPKAS